MHTMRELTELASTDAARGKLSDALLRARYAGERTIITIRGRPAAAIVSLADLDRLQAPAGTASAPERSR
jgi:prevent-host-death family protein